MKSLDINVLPKPKIILISGKQGSGKSTLSEMLWRKFCAEDNTLIAAHTVRFAQPLYEMHDAVKAVARDYNIPVEEKEGKLLQFLGTEWGRELKGVNVWVNALRSLIEQTISLDRGFAGTNRENVFLIDDCRFKNELSAFDDWCTFKIRLFAAHEARKERTKGWRDNISHPSEIDLDDVNGNEFDLILDTENYSKETNLALAYGELKNFWGKKQ